MKKLRVSIVVAIFLMSATIVLAQTNVGSWPFFVEVSQDAEQQGIYDVIVPFDVLDKAREDLADLRLFDANGREIPYAVRILKEVNERRAIEASIFNQTTSGATTSEVTLDLGESRGEHNEVEVDTTGTNFRRRVEVEGSDSGRDWKTLESGSVIFGFEAQNSSVKSNRISYPVSRYRYLRVKVFADELTDDKPPSITGVRVMMAFHEEGMLSTWAVNVPMTQLLRNQGEPASSWNIDFGARVPCDRLTLDMADKSFSRHFQLENVDDPQNIRLVAQGDLVRRIDEEPTPLTINLDQEEHVRKLRLVVTDYSNETLSIMTMNASAPARQLLFELKEPLAQPVRLFFGNSKITAPHYDFEKELSAKLTKSPTSVSLGARSANPTFTPEPLPLTERVPWLIYVVLAVSSVALALVLISLTRKTLQTPTNEPVGKEASSQ